MGQPSPHGTVRSFMGIYARHGSTASTSSSSLPAIPTTCGACLEVMNADYTHRFGSSRVTSSDVLDVNPANTAATVVADLGEPASLPLSASTA